MRRIYWDSMLFIYLLEGSAKYTSRVRHLLTQSYEREDRLFTSYLALGEVMAGAKGPGAMEKSKIIRETAHEMGFTYLPFDSGAVDTFSHLRAVHRVKIADAIHLSCAAAEGIDLFLTGDKELLKLHVPGIHFIADFDTPVI